jgi:subtilisin family serine protease
MTKLDALVFQWLSMNQARAAAGDTTASAEMATVTVVASGPREALASAGLTIQHELAGIYTGNVRLSDLPALEALPDVLAIASLSPEVAQTNESVPAIRAPSVWRGSPPRQGEGVLIGIVDSGIDIFHGAFRADDGSTRILAIWDQTLPPTQPAGGHGPPGTAGPASIGRVFSEAEINAALRGAREDFEHFDPSGHGTNVAGIAGGDGSQAGDTGDALSCPLAGTYQGVAPRAKFLLVKNTFGRTTHGVEWIFEQAAGRPTVVNLSMATDVSQPRNGYGFNAVRFDHLLDEHTGGGVTTARRGRAIVVSAGNDGMGDLHTSTTVVADTAGQLEFELLEPQPTQIRLLLAYGTATAPGAAEPTATESLQVTLRRQDMNEGVTVSPAQPTSFTDLAGVRVSATMQVHHPWGTGGAGGLPRVWGMHAVDIVLTSINERIPHRVWEIELSDLAGRRTDVDLYIEVGAVVSMPRIAARGTFTFRLRFQDNYGRVGDAAIITYGGPARLDVCVTRGNVRSEVVSPGQTRTVQVGRDSVLVKSVLDGSDPPGLHRIAVSLSAPPGESLGAGPWAVELVETAGHAVEPRCYSPNDRPRGGFLTPVTVRRPVRERTLENTGRNLVIVGAVDDGLVRPDWSSRGPTQPTALESEGREKPDLVAPGVDIAGPMTNRGAPSVSDCCGTFYTDVTGTSQACAHVAGVVALMLQKNPGLTYDVIRSLLVTHTLDAAAAQPNFTGGGVVNAEAVLAAVPPAPGGGGGGGPTTIRADDRPEPSRVPSLRLDFSPQRLAALRQATDSSESGRLLFALVSKHFDEAFRIVQTRRRAMAGWHRVGGPKLLREVVRWSGASDAPLIPAEVGNRSVREGVPYLLSALAHYGSPALRADVARYAAFVAQLPGATLREVSSPVTPRTTSGVDTR